MLAHSKPEAYSEPWYIQNYGKFRTKDIFRTLGYLEPEAYSKPCQASTMERFEKQLTPIIIFASYNYFRNINFSILLRILSFYLYSGHSATQNVRNKDMLYKT